MKYLILFIIKCYHTLLPMKMRRKCLHKESCSNHVFRITKDEGFIKGIEAFKFRFHNCNPNYWLTKVNGKVLLITSNYEIIEEDYINESILEDK